MKDEVQVVRSRVVCGRRLRGEKVMRCWRDGRRKGRGGCLRLHDDRGGILQDQGAAGFWELDMEVRNVAAETASHVDEEWAVIVRVAEEALVHGIVVHPTWPRFAIACHEVVECRSQTSVLLQDSEEGLVSLQCMLDWPVRVVVRDLVVGLCEERGEMVEGRYHAAEAVD